MNNLDSFPMYNVTKLDNQTNDKGTVKYNVISDTIIQTNSWRGNLLPVVNSDLVQSQKSTQAASTQCRAELTQYYDKYVSKTF
jgi:hypothetical protein